MTCFHRFCSERPAHAGVVHFQRDIANSGTSCVFVTHNLYHAFQVCDRFVVMAHGMVAKNVVKSETTLDELTSMIMNQ
ncbi:MAG: hypothetical protein HY245_05420 [Rhizobiales bacterium]|nr:hypothetical protein [Hyphomicrobiales bacterium]MBI3672853.1 hypothetical protein [Hyphomicrobiales bacterium]